MSENKIIIYQKSKEEVAFELYKDLTDLTAEHYKEIAEKLGITATIRFKQKCFLLARELVLEGREGDISKLLN